MDTVATIKELAAKHFGRDVASIDEDAQIAQLGIDSLGFLEFLFELEDGLDVSIPQDTVTNVRTLRDLAAIVDKLISAKGAPQV